MVKDWTSSQKSATRQGYLFTALLYDIVLEVPGRAIRQEKEIKSIQIWKEKSETISISRQHDLVNLKNEGNPRNIY